MSLDIKGNDKSSSRRCANSSVNFVDDIRNMMSELHDVNLKFSYSNSFSLSAHAVMLSCRSEWFKNELLKVQRSMIPAEPLMEEDIGIKEDKRGGGKGILNIPLPVNISIVAMEVVLNFMYTDILSLPNSISQYVGDNCISMERNLNDCYSNNGSTADIRERVNSEEKNMEEDVSM